MLNPAAPHNHTEPFVDLEAGASSCPESKSKEKRDKGQAEQRTRKRKLLVWSFIMFLIVLVACIAFCSSGAEERSVAFSADQLLSFAGAVGLADCFPEVKKAIPATRPTNPNSSPREATEQGAKVGTVGTQQNKKPEVSGENVDEKSVWANVDESWRIPYENMWGGLEDGHNAPLRKQIPHFLYADVAKEKLEQLCKEDGKLGQLSKLASKSKLGQLSKLATRDNFQMYNQRKMEDYRIWKREVWDKL